MFFIWWVMLRVETWICATLFAIGIIAGMTYLNVNEAAPGDPVSQRAPDVQHEPDESVPVGAPYLSMASQSGLGGEPDFRPDNDSL